jgi:hypothetical protein
MWLLRDGHDHDNHTRTTCSRLNLERRSGVAIDSGYERAMTFEGKWVARFLAPIVVSMLLPISLALRSREVSQKLLREELRLSTTRSASARVPAAHCGTSSRVNAEKIGIAAVNGRVARASRTLFAAA